MGLFLVYLIKSALCLSGFYLFHRLLLSKETFHRFNRIALLSVLLLALLIPLVQATTMQRTDVSQAFLTMEELLLLATLNASSGEMTQAIEPAGFSWVYGLFILYWLGVFVLIVRHIASLSRLFRLLHSSQKERLDHGITLYIHDRAIAPFSWMKAVVISRKDLEENGQEILLHECAHISKRHSWDLLLADCCLFFQWFNPGAWLIRQELQTIHEYEADDKVLQEGIDAKNYQLLLIKKAVGTRLYSMANSFNHSQLKKRIAMMLKEKSSPWARLKYLYILPLASVAVVAFARPEVAETLEEISVAKVNDLTAVMEAKTTEMSGLVAAVDSVKPKKKVTVVSSDDDLFIAVEQMPDFPGGQGALMEFLKNNVKYPKEAATSAIQGRVIVQFVIMKDGTVAQPKVVRAVDPSLDAEALRVIRLMPKWTPGKQRGKAVNVKYTVPVMFRLNNENKEKTVSQGIKIQPDEMTIKSDYSKALIIVDGKEVLSEQMNQISPNDIESISVLKGAAATATYGDKGKNGVIVVTLKNKVVPQEEVQKIAK
ncbi:MAG: TonB family protein [Bacteroidia bacterium]|nr:TonB family protein [Bacteroidia bacterium]